ncbi:MAG: hypothetical protein Q9218_005429 [Villophora microphyllina]
MKRVDDERGEEVVPATAWIASGKSCDVDGGKGGYASGRKKSVGVVLLPNVWDGGDEDGGRDDGRWECNDDGRVLGMMGKEAAIVGGSR